MRGGMPTGGLAMRGGMPTGRLAMRGGRHERGSGVRSYPARVAVGQLGGARGSSGEIGGAQHRCAPRVERRAERRWGELEGSSELRRNGLSVMTYDGLRRPKLEGRDAAELRRNELELELRAPRARRFNLAHRARAHRVLLIRQFRAHHRVLLRLRCERSELRDGCEGTRTAADCL